MLQSSTCTLVCREFFSVLHVFNLWGSLHYRTWFAYSNDKPPQKCSRSLWANKLDATPLVPLESSFLCMHPLHVSHYSSHHIYLLDFCHLRLSSLVWAFLILFDFLPPVIILFAILSAFNLACAPSLHECSTFKERISNRRASDRHSGVVLW